MEELFLKAVNQGITASYLVLALVLLRPLLKKAPRWLVAALWALVALRLVLPWSIESVLSLIPSTEPFPETFAYQLPDYNLTNTNSPQTVDICNYFFR